MVGLTSAAGMVGFLSEPDPDLQVFALEQLNDQIDFLWTEVAGSVGEIEALYEDESFPERQLAALVASKVYYNLQEYDESMLFALGAGKLFDIDKEGDYEDTIVSKCVDTYIQLSALQKLESAATTSGKEPSQLITSFPSASNGATSTSAGLASPTTPFSQSTLPSKSLLSREDSSVAQDQPRPRGASVGAATAQPPIALPAGMQKQLNAIIERLFERCYQEKSYRQVVGIAIEARNLEQLRQVIVRARQDQTQGKKSEDVSDEIEELMEYVLDICMSVVQERGLRNEVSRTELPTTSIIVLLTRRQILKLILDLLSDTSAPEYFSIAKCIVYLNEHKLASDILVQLVEKNDPKLLAVAYQIAFDMYDNSTQEFLRKVRDALPSTAAEEEVGQNGAAENMDQDDRKTATESDQLLSELNESAGTSANGAPAKEKASPELRKAFSSVQEILSGSKSIELELEFLYRNNRTDTNTLDKIRDSLEARNSIFHTAVSLANAFMHVGTTNDRFFRLNLEWLAKAVNWSKFTATAALGVIHRGNLTQGQKLLEPYLPKENVGAANAGSAYSQGGSLYALGLIYANHETVALDLIRKHFKDSNDEVVKHGGALGLGVAGMATGDEGIYTDLKDVLYSDSALNGEAVGISMGLIMLGTGNIKAIEEMISYAHETQHEKIVRGLALGMALIMYNREEAADELINGLLEDPDPILRYGGIQTIALAYCGSSSNKAVRKLLHVAVSDVSDDVRRMAVMSLGFVLFRKPNSVPRMVELLSESYNPHVRYGAAMALGISCAGTGLDEAIDLLEPMIKDPTDFVRQGALIALSMIMIQQNEAMNPKVGTIRKTLQKAIGDRHEDAMTKFGSAVSLGIIDAGGRNCTISMQTQTGNLNMSAIVGMAVFTQYWYWFPLTHFLSLSFTPTAVIAVDQDLEVPSFNFHSATRPSLFDYPPAQQVKIEDIFKKVETAILSTTAQAKRRAQKKEKQQRRESMDIDQPPATPKTGAADDKMDTDEAAIKTEDEKKEGDVLDGKDSEDKKAESLKKKAEKEKVGYDLENMSRVLPAQLKFISFPDSRYEPVKKVGSNHLQNRIVLMASQPTGGVLLVTDKQPSEPKSLITLKARKNVQPAATVPASNQQQPLADVISQLQSQRPADREASGAAAGAGVLTAVDEDVEGGEEAPVPNEFDYYTDAEEEEES